MADDEAAVRAKLAALEAEVKADVDASRARKEAAVARVKAQQDAEQAAQRELREEKAELLAPKRAKPARASLQVDDDDGSDLGGALELAKRANRVGKELARKPTKGEKSWVKSGVASMVLGPIGWLYAGSLREAVPASAAWIVLAAIASKILPTVLLWPVLMVALPLSAIGGVVYALQYNRHGGRQRLFDKKDDDAEPAPKPPKQLKRP